MRPSRHFLWLLAVVTPCVGTAQPVPVGSEFQISTYTSGGLSPRVASDAEGNFIVVWLGAGNHIYGQRYGIFGEARGTEFRVDTYARFANFGLGFLRDIDISAGPAGNFVVVWTSFDDEDFDSPGVFGQRFASSGAKVGTEFRVNSYTTGFQYFPAVAGDPADGFVVAWEGYYNDDSGRRKRLLARWFDGDGSPLGDDFQVASYTSFPQWVDIVQREDGSFVFVWNKKEEVVGQIFHSDGSRLGSEFQVGADGEFEAIPAVKSDEKGNFVVVWSVARRDGDSFGMFGQRFDSSASPVESEFQVNRYTMESQYNTNHSLFVGAEGDFVVTWTTQTDLSNFPDGVSAQKFDSTGERVGPELQVNTATIGTQAFPAVGGGPDGFVITWMSDAQEDGHFGIFGQRYLNEAVCPETPASDCLPASRSALIIRRPPPETGSFDSLVWGWRKKPVVDWDSSSSASAYLLCLYDSSGLASEARATGGCDAESCWGVTTSAGGRYRNHLADNRGRTRRRPDDRLSTVLLRGRGANLSLPALPLDDTPPVTVQLHPNSGPDCFEAAYLGPALRNDSVEYRNRTP